MKQSKQTNSYTTTSTLEKGKKRHFTPFESLTGCMAVKEAILKSHFRYGNFLTKSLFGTRVFLSNLSVTSFLKILSTVISKNFSKFLNYTLQNI